MSGKRGEDDNRGVISGPAPPQEKEVQLTAAAACSNIGKPCLCPTSPFILGGGTHWAPNGC